jgi:hypothetical protein
MKIQRYSALTLSCLLLFFPSRRVFLSPFPLQSFWQLSLGHQLTLDDFDPLYTFEHFRSRLGNQQ